MRQNPWRRPFAVAHPTGEPQQNGYVESFNDKMPDECLNVRWFENLWNARQKIAAWQKEYNEERPHSSLSYQTPARYAGNFSHRLASRFVRRRRSLTGCESRMIHSADPGGRSETWQQKLNLPVKENRLSKLLGGSRLKNQESRNE